MPNPFEKTISFDILLSALAAAGEATRLRLLALLAEAELTVSELVTILGQSQPRISRHLKLLVEAGLVERHREGAWVFFFLAPTGPAASLGHDIVARLAPQDAARVADRARLAEVRRARAEQAAHYFAAHATQWDELRALHISEEAVEAAVREIVGAAPLNALLDLGTGTGRMLELLRATRKPGGRRRSIAADVEPGPRQARKSRTSQCQPAARRHLRFAGRTRFL